MIYSVAFTNKFLKDAELAKKQGKDMEKLLSIIDILTSGEKLPSSRFEHKLHGEYESWFECHITPDWLLIYKKVGDKLVLYRTGSHSFLFK